MQVVKASGEFERFDPRKIKRTCTRAGCSSELADSIAKEVEKKAYDGISTKDILKLTLSLLRKKMPLAADRYDLKGALLRLGPAGFVFEEFIGQILKRYGYSNVVHSIIKGYCVSHEIDVVAENTEGRFMIECKYHNVPGIYTGLKEALYTYARFLDLKEGFSKNGGRDFTQPWLICNTKFSEDAIQYASCKGMRLIGWNYPENHGLEHMIETQKLYPITMLRSLDVDSLNKLLTSKIVLAPDMLQIPMNELSKTGVSLRKLKALCDDAKGICG